MERARGTPYARGMRMRYAVLLSVGFVSQGCGEKAASETSTASAAPAGSARSSGGATGAGAASASSSCPEGAYKDDKLKFCIKLPAGWKAKPPEEKVNGIMVGFEEDKFSSPFSVKVEKATTLKTAKEIIEGMKKPFDDKEKKESGGEGDTMWVLTKFSNGATLQFDLYTPGAEGMLSCYVNASVEKADPLIEACKTLRKL